MVRCTMLCDRTAIAAGWYGGFALKADDSNS